MTQTPLPPSLIARVTDAARYVISGVTPSTWFGPLQPLKPMAPEDVTGRRFDYPTGYNLNYTPRSDDSLSFEDLRALADNCDILRAVIETRKDQIEALDWTVRAVPTSDKHPTLSDEQKQRINTITQFLHCPDGEHSFSQWLRQILEDMFVIDAACLYKHYNRGGQLYALEIVDGATIKILLDDKGRSPLPPDPAYQQVLKGVPAVDYTRDELMYFKHNPRSHKVYGYSHVEQVMVTVNILIRRALHQLEYYKDGSQPDAFVGLPKEWNQDQVAQFQRHFDQLMSGNLAQRRRLRFMPGDFKYQETKAPPLKDVYDEFLARIICFVFSVSPEPFVSHVNRATAESSQSRAIDEGLAPLQRYVRGIMNRIIKVEFNSPDLEFAWQDTREQDPKDAAAIDVSYVGAGIMTVNEVRANMGLPPIGVAISGGLAAPDSASAESPSVSNAAVESKSVPREKDGSVKKNLHRYNENHLGPGPGGGQFTTADRNGQSLGLAPGSGKPQRSALKPPSVASDRGTQVAENDKPSSGQTEGEAFASSPLGFAPGVYLPTLPEGLFGEGVGAAGEAATSESSATDWTLGDHKSDTTWANQMESRGWTPDEITETLNSSEKFSAPNFINPQNSATGYVNQTTGKYVVQDDVTKEIIQISKSGFNQPKLHKE